MLSRKTKIIHFNLSTSHFFIVPSKELIRSAFKEKQYAKSVIFENAQKKQVKYLKYITAINSKSVNDLKIIINTFVESVIVFDDKVEINLIIFLIHINGGGERCLTPVQKK